MIGFRKSLLSAYFLFHPRWIFTLFAFVSVLKLEPILPFTLSISSFRAEGWRPFSVKNKTQGLWTEGFQTQLRVEVPYNKTRGLSELLHNQYQWTSYSPKNREEKRWKKS